MFPNTFKRFNLGKNRWKSSEITCFVTHTEEYSIRTVQSHPPIPSLSVNPSPVKIAYRKPWQNTYVSIQGERIKNS
jgi:hypothetical protein